MSTALTTLMKDVALALDFDRRERSEAGDMAAYTSSARDIARDEVEGDISADEDAYRKYLECVLRVSTSLLKALHINEGHVLMSSDTTKMVKLGQQCMDRVSNLVQNKFALKYHSESTKSMSLPLVPSSSQAKHGSQTTPGTPVSGQTTPCNTQQSQITSPDGVFSPTDQKTTRPFNRKSGTDTDSVRVTGKMTTKQMSPLEMASKQNQQLLTAFRKRQAMTKNRSASATLSLTLQRKMAENLAIAKAQEEALAKKMKERQARLEEQAAKRFHTPVGMSEEEQKQRQVYRRVLEFEQEQVWMADLRRNLEEKPTDIDVISELVTAILGCSEHPLTVELFSYQNKLLDKITHIVSRKEHVVERIQVPLPEELHCSLKPFHESRKPCSELETNKEEKELQKVDEHRTLHDRAGEVEKEESSSIDQGDKNTVTTDELEEHKRKHITKPENGSSEENLCDMSEVTADIKNEITRALIDGEKVMKRLNTENKIVKSLCKQASEEYELYNQENMDDLFESSDDDVEIKDTDVKDSTEIGQDDGAIKPINNSDNAKDDVSDESVDESTIMDKGKNIVYARNPSFEHLEGRIAKLKNEAYHRHLKGIAEDILTSIEKVQVLFVIAFEQLDSAEGRDQCNVRVEDYFFRPLWKHLLVLFRLANEPKEISLAYMMTKNQSVYPSAFQVRSELCLESPAKSSCYPYHSAVEELKGISECSTMLEKLDSLVKASKQVMVCVEQYYTEKGETPPAIGADDLLPVLCYVVCKSSLPQLVSECHAVEKFIHEGYMFGEEGYCLTSFQTAINFLVSEGLQLSVD